MTHDPLTCEAGVCRLEREAAERDAERVRNELRDRLDRCDPFDHEAALREIAHRNPDLVTEVLDQNGAEK